MVFIKDVSANADAGTASKWGGNDINYLDDYFDNVDITPKVAKINTRTYFRDDKFEWRNPADTFSYIVSTGAITANRALGLPVLTADATWTFKEIDNNWTVMQTINKSGGATNDDMFTLYRTTSTTTRTWELNWDAQQADATQVPYAAIRAEIVASTNGAQSGMLHLRTTNAGTEQTSLSVTETGKLRCGGGNTRIEFDDAGLTARRVITFQDVASKQAALAFANTYTEPQTVAKNTNVLFTQYRASNVAGDAIDQEFHLNSSTSVERAYGRVKFEIETNTNAAEDGLAKLGVMVNGALQNFIQFSEATGGTGILGVALGGQTNRVIIAPTLMTTSRTFDYPDIGSNGGDIARVKVQTHDYFEMEDEFTCGSITTTNTSNIIGVLNWGLTGSTPGTPTVTAGVTTHPGIITITTGATSGNNCRIHLTDAAATAFCDPRDVEHFAFIIRIPTITSIIVRVGLMQDVSAASGGTAGAFFQFSSAVDADSWSTITRQASTSTTNTSAGANAVANNWMLLEGRRLSGGNWEFYINNTLAFTHSANLPTTACNIGVHTETATTAARPVDIDYFKLRTIKLAQRWT